jgi:hypothetical protein
LAALVPAIPIIERCDILIEIRRDKPGDDASILPLLLEMSLSY